MKAMLQFSTGTRQQLQLPLFEQIGRYRREVFIERLGWELNTTNGMELDEFDGADAVYVCSYDDDGSVNGVARLLPTTGSYLLAKIFPQLWGGTALPCDKATWELSRFAMVGSDELIKSHVSQSSAARAPDLMRQVIRTAKLLGANTLITVSPIGMEKLLRKNGYQVKRAGRPQVYMGSSIVALQIELDSQNNLAAPRNDVKNKK